MTRSPFGLGVRLPSSPRLRRRKSMEDLPHVLLSNASDESPSLEQEIMSDLPLNAKRVSARALREVASSETIRESRHADETITFAMAAEAGKEKEALDDLDAKEAPQIPADEQRPEVDTRIFDVMFALEASEWRPASSLSQTCLSVSSSDCRRHKASKFPIASVMY